MGVEPVIIEEVSHNEKKVNAAQDAQIKEENINTTENRNEQEIPQEELKEFNIFELLSKIQNELNKDENELNHKY